MPTATEPPSSLTPAATWTSLVQHFSERLIAAQRPIRLQDALSWDPQIEHEFLSQDGRELPRVDRDYYRLQHLAFDPHRKQEELQDLERDVQRSLGMHSGAGRILLRMCRDLTSQVRLLVYRGTRTFVQISQRLYGSALAPDSEAWLNTLDSLKRRHPGQLPGNGRHWTAEQAADELLKRLRPCFPGWDELQIKLVDGAAAETGPVCDGLKIRRDHSYQARDLRFHEVHDGWVHLGTTYNARQQSVCEFLSVASAGAFGTQSGLARLSAFAAGAVAPVRVEAYRKQLEAIRMAESGADFREVFRFFRQADGNDRECYRHTQRIFRGSLPQCCGPFTKELATAAALSMLFEPQAHCSETLSLLFCGKTALDDLDALRELRDDGWLAPPAFMLPVHLD